MKRRSFLGLLGIGAASAVIPIKKPKEKKVGWKHYFGTDDKQWDPNALKKVECFDDYGKVKGVGTLSKRGIHDVGVLLGKGAITQWEPQQLQFVKSLNRPAKKFNIIKGV